jgi:ABC-type amino acid transport substrate-binding protein
MANRAARLVVVGVAVLSVASVGAAGPTPGLPAKLRVLVAADEMPEMFSFALDGPPGLERELVEGFGRVHGLSVQVVPVRDFDQIFPMLLRGEGDLATGIVETADRRRRVAFTDEIFPVRHLVVTRQPKPAVARVEDLRALRVGVIAGTSWEQATVEAGVPKAKRVSFRDAGALLAGLRAGEVDAVVMALLDYALASKRDAGLEAGVFLGSSLSAAWAVRPGDTALLAALDDYLRGMGQARHALMFRYLSEEALSLIALARRE